MEAGAAQAHLPIALTPWRFFGFFLGVQKEARRRSGEILQTEKTNLPLPPEEGLHTIGGGLGEAGAVGDHIHGEPAEVGTGGLGHRLKDLRLGAGVVHHDDEAGGAVGADHLPQPQGADVLTALGHLGHRLQHGLGDLVRVAHHHLGVLLDGLLGKGRQGAAGMAVLRSVGSRQVGHGDSLCPLSELHLARRRRCVRSMSVMPSDDEYDAPRRTLFISRI